MTWSRSIDRHLAELRARNLTEATCYGVAGALHRFELFCGGRGVTDLVQIRLEHVLAFADELSNKVRESTRYQQISAVRRWLRWAVYRDHLLANPLEDWKLRHPPVSYRWVPTEAEMLLVLDAPESPRDRMIAEFLYGTGLRVQEAAGVDLGDLDLQQRLVHVRRGKGGKGRVLPLGEHLVAHLTTFLDEVRPRCNERALFLHKKGGRLNVHGFAAIFRDLGQQLEMPRLSVHSIRHAYATHLLLNGAPLLVVQRLLGHDSIASTAIYTRMLPTDVQAEVLRTHPRGKVRKNGGKTAET